MKVVQNDLTWLHLVGVVAGEGRGDGAECGCQAISPNEGLLRVLPLLCVGVPAGEPPEKSETLNLEHIFKLLHSYLIGTQIWK
jgi:hypothetical protein